MLTRPWWGEGPLGVCGREAEYHLKGAVAEATQDTLGLLWTHEGMYLPH